MAGLVSAIHVFFLRNKRRGCPHKAGPDKGERTRFLFRPALSRRKLPSRACLLGNRWSFEHLDAGYPRSTGRRPAPDVHV